MKDGFPQILVGIIFFTLFVYKLQGNEIMEGILYLTMGIGFCSLGFPKLGWIPGLHKFFNLLSVAMIVVAIGLFVFMLISGSF